MTGHCCRELLSSAGGASGGEAWDTEWQGGTTGGAGLSSVSRDMVGGGGGRMR
jgi:hypothetical protein